MAAQDCDAVITKTPKNNNENKRFFNSILSARRGKALSCSQTCLKLFYFLFHETLWPHKRVKFTPKTCTTPVQTIAPSGFPHVVEVCSLSPAYL